MTDTKPLWSDYTARHSLYAGIMYAGVRTRDERGRLLSFSAGMMAKGHAILSADRAFFEARREEILGEREEIAASFDAAGDHDVAALVRARPAPPEWRKP